MKKLLTLFLSLIALLPIYAQTERGEQVLVFRNTGEVNLFFSEQLDSIVYSRLDTANVEHENIVSQIFYSPDTAIVIPINEIDSVAFGSRNETVFKKEVRQLNDVDCQWIIKYDGSNIFYKLFHSSIPFCLFYAHHAGQADLRMYWLFLPNRP